MTGAPPIDPRRRADLVNQTEALLARYAGWRPDPEQPDALDGLVAAFGRLAEVALERLNRVPEKAFLAFLDLLGVDLLPPRAALAPVTFTLAAGATGDVVVPRGTPIEATRTPDDATPVVFTTQRELVVSRTVPIALVARDTATDRFADLSDLLGTPAAAGGQATFDGTTAVGHHLDLGDDRLVGLPAGATVTIGLRSAGATSWAERLRWAVRDAAGWRDVPAQTTAVTGGADVVLTDAVGLPGAAEHGRETGWLRSTLTTSLPGEAMSNGQQDLEHRDLPVDAAVAGGVVIASDRPFTALEVGTDAVYLACERAFAKPGALVEIAVTLDPRRVLQPSASLRLAWEVFDGSRWKAVGTSTPHAQAVPGSEQDFADGTLALTRGASVTLRAPGTWDVDPPEIPHDAGGRWWLRARVAAGGYGTEPTAPRVVGLRISYRWPLPRLDTVTLRTATTATPLPLVAARTDRGSLDLSRDVLPFGPRPAHDDTCWFDLGDAVGVPGATVQLHVTLRRPARKGAMLLWEYHDATAGGWRPLGRTDTPGGANAFTDTTAALSTTGSVRFSRPAGFGRSVVGGQEGAWIRVRLVGGSYGADVTYRVKDPGPGYELVPATLDPPVIGTLAVSTTHNGTPVPPAAAVSVDDLQERPHATGTAFTPYVPAEDAEPALDVGFTVSPGGAFPTPPTTLHLSLSAASDVPKAGTGPRAAGTPVVAWQCLTLHGWATLPARDETRGLTRSGLVTFVAPVGLPPVRRHGVEAVWLRARWERGAFDRAPALVALRANTTWATQDMSRDEVLGSSTGAAAQTFRAAAAPLLAGAVVQVAEPGTPSTEELAAHEAELGRPAVTDRSDGVGVWVRWVEVPDFHGSGPRSRHYTLDHATGEVRFGDGRRGLVPPQGRASLRLTARSGGGAAGNRPAGELSTLKQAIAGIASVTNPEPAVGGADGETGASAARRGPATIRHRGRAVAAVDYEDLVRAEVPDVARVVASSVHDKADAGRVVVIVVPDVADATPTPDPVLLGRVRDVLRAVAPATVDLVVRGPSWRRIVVEADVVADLHADVARLSAEVYERIAAFLHPLHGGKAGEGWPFGRRPHRSDLYALIGQVTGVDHVRRLMLTDHGVPADGAASALVTSGIHRISVAGAVGDARGGEA
jgi:predicted phage baseplate assembly protein